MDFLLCQCSVKLATKIWGINQPKVLIVTIEPIRILELVRRLTNRGRTVWGAVKDNPNLKIAPLKTPKTKFLLLDFPDISPYFFSVNLDFRATIPHF